MKKLTITSLLCLTTLFTLNAQEDKEKEPTKITYGLKGGLNLNTPRGYFVDETGSNLGFHVGAFAEIKLSKKFALQPELQYSTQGAKINFENVAPVFGGGNFEISDSYDYLNFSLMSKYFVMDKLSVEVGPQIGYLLSAKRDYVSGPITTDLIDSSTKLDFGVNFGIGYKIDDHLSFGVRYNYGLTKVTNSPSGNPQNGFGKIKNSVLQASIGYSF